WFIKAKVENSTLIDDREDTEASLESEVAEKDDTAEINEAVSGESVSMTASNIGDSNNVLFALGGGVVGVIIGLFIGLIIRRKKQTA
ncbi:MAG: LPXTG cell wall anchor domain-containing protein, partial [Eubacterium sp.]|nr:LPXTG cell wall anchor domain-containing protein [Eubacterium sp.]